MIWKEKKGDGYTHAYKLTSKHTHKDTHKDTDKGKFRHTDMQPYNHTHTQTDINTCVHAVTIHVSCMLTRPYYRSHAYVHPNARTLQVYVITHTFDMSLYSTQSLDCLYGV